MKALLIRTDSELRMKALLVFMSIITVPLCCSAQSSSNSEAEVWPAISATFEVTSRSRVKVSYDRHKGEDSFYNQNKVGAIFSFRMKRIVSFIDHVDQENEYHLVLGSGYEFLRTDQGNGVKSEHRLLFQLTPKYVLGPKLLAQDRSQLEFRWIGGQYNFRYRNKLMVSRQFKIDRVRFAPYVSGELFWDRNRHAWTENQYSFGAQIPYRKLLALDVYYMHQNCTTCSLDPLNIFGLSLALYPNWPKRN